jgi:hypothetical protein
VDGAEDGEVLEEGEAAVGLEDGGGESGEGVAAARVGCGGDEDERLAEEVVDHGLDAPGDVVLDDDLLSGDGVAVRGEVGLAGVVAGDARGHAPLLGLAVGALGSVLLGDGAGEHGVPVVVPEAAAGGAVGVLEAGEELCEALGGDSGLGGDGVVVGLAHGVLTSQPMGGRCARGGGRAQHPRVFRRESTDKIFTFS